MTTLLVTSTANGTGKTAISIALARLAQDHGASVGYMKPKGTRLESVVGKTRDQDPILAREVLDIEADLEDLEPIVYSPTFVREAIRGRVDPPELRDRITESFDRLATEKDVMIVEGGGQLWTGGIVDLTDAAVADALDAETLLVSRYEDPIAVDELLAATETLGESLTGILFNAVDDADFDQLTEETVPFLDGRGFDTVGVVPRDPDLGGITVDDLATRIGADVLTPEAGTGCRIERFLVGAMGAESALEQFRRTRNAAVVTGADRTDLQSAALEAPGVNCLVLTGSRQPPGAILGKAADANVPVMLVQTDTRTTVDQVEAELRVGRTRSAETIERMVDLLADAVDVEALLDLSD